MYLVYSGLFLLSLLLALPYLMYRSLREPGYARSFWERVLPTVKLNSRAGAGPGDGRNGRTIWIHAVSVGEVLAASILLPHLRKEFPQDRIVVSVTTVTGREVAEKRLRAPGSESRSGAGSGAELVFYCPLDFGLLVRRVVRTLRPRAIIIMETEIWPHLIRECRRAGVATLLANARISDDSYPRYRWVRFFLRKVLPSLDAVCAQNEAYARRLIELGAPEPRVHITGNIKYDGTPEAEPGEVLGLLPPGKQIWIAGSTSAPEEAIVLSVFARLRESFPSLFLVIAPRHATRFDEVFDLARAREPSTVRRTSLRGASAQGPDTRVLVLDTLGELASSYAAADLVFVGGSLVPRGGHNVIEPASTGAAILFGPSMENFADIARDFLAAGAARRVRDEAELEAAARELLGNDEERKRLGANARGLVEQARGRSASRQTVLALVEALRSRESESQCERESGGEQGKQPQTERL
jgi:3-deoxy-D-manno-octulosonic-acid transferase